MTKFLAAFVLTIAALTITPTVAQAAEPTPIDHLVDCDDSFWTLAPACNPAPLNLDGPVAPYDSHPLAHLIDCGDAFWSTACGN